MSRNIQALQDARLARLNRAANTQKPAARADGLRSLSRAVIASAVAASDPSIQPSYWIEKNWPSDHGALAVLKAAVSPTMTSDAPGLVVEAFLSDLTSQSAAADLFGLGISLQFSRAAAIRVPALASIEAPFVEEAAAIRSNNRTRPPAFSWRGISSP